MFAFILLLGIFIIHGIIITCAVVTIAVINYNRYFNAAGVFLGILFELYQQFNFVQVLLQKVVKGYQVLGKCSIAQELN